MDIDISLGQTQGKFFFELICFDKKEVFFLQPFSQWPVRTKEGSSDNDGCNIVEQGGRGAAFIAPDFRNNYTDTAYVK